MRRRLPPKGTPARQAHEHLLRANRQLAKALGLLAQVDLDADSREMIREETRGVADALTLLRHKLKRPRQ